MAGATLTTLSAILKDYYLPPVVEQLNNTVLLLQRLEARDQELFGNQAVIPVHTGRSGGIGARAEGGTLPTAGNQVYARAVYDLKYLYGRITVTGPSMAKTASEAGAFLQALKSEIDGVQNDLKKDVARQLYGNGDGILAGAASSGPSTTVTLSTDEAMRKGQIYNGQIVSVGTTANASSLAAAQTVSAVNIAAKTFLIQASITTIAATHFVFRDGSVSATGTVYETNGLQNLIATAANTFGGIDASQAANSYWDNQRLASGGTLTVGNMQQAWNTVQFAGGEVSSMYTDLAVQRFYYTLLQAQVRYTEPTTLKGGFSVLTFMDKPLIADVDAPFGKLFFCDERFLKLFSNRDWHFLDEDGHILKWISGQDAWDAVLARYMQLGASRRNTELVMTGITDTTGV